MADQQGASDVEMSDDEILAAWRAGELKVTSGATRQKRGWLLINELRPFEWTIHLPWFNRHRPYVALHVSQWGWELRRGRERRILHVQVMWGFLFSEHGSHRSWTLRGRVQRDAICATSRSVILGMSNEPNVRNVNPDKPDKAPDVAHGAPGQAHSSGAKESEVVPSEGLWSEDSDRVWLPLAYGDTPERVKRLAYIGRSLPIAPVREFSCSYDDLSVKRVFVRPGYSWEEGWAGRGPDTWWYATSSRDPHVVEAWEVSFA